MRFTRCRSFGLRQIAAVSLSRLRMGKALVEMCKTLGEHMKYFFFIIIPLFFCSNVGSSIINDYDLLYKSERLNQISDELNVTFFPVYFMHYHEKDGEYGAIRYPETGQFNKMLIEHFIKKYKERFIGLGKIVTEDDVSILKEFVKNMDQFNLSRIDLKTKKPIKLSLTKFTTPHLPEKFNKYMIIFIKGLEIQSNDGIRGYISVYFYDSKENTIIYDHIFPYDPTKFTYNMDFIFKHIIESF